MALFLGVHKIPAGMDENQITEGWNKYKGSASSKGLRILGAVYSKEKGFAYCQTEAQSADEVREAHQAVEIPLEDIIEVKPLS
jgi:hypothetical protein